MKGKKKFDNEYEPIILAFCCNWCSYAGADLAGVSRFQYPSNIRIVRVMCSSRVEPTFVLRAFYNGIDGVLVIGCHPGDCHYISGFDQTKVRMEHLQNLLKMIGIEQERFKLHSISASEGKQFSELITEFTQSIKKTGELKISKKLGIIEFENKLIRKKKNKNIIQQNKIKDNFYL
ncbi:MAG: hydrogenase iron-sulfur subunit [Promethearchaeota archaeon]